MADINGWYVRENAFTKGFMDYVVEVKQTFWFALHKVNVVVTIWKGSGQEDTKHTVYYDNFEDAFAFVNEFANQKFFDQAVEEYFNDRSTLQKTDS